MRRAVLGLLVLGCVACGHGSNTASPNGLNHETDQFAFDLLKLLAECLRENPPLADGNVRVAADMASAGSPARVFDPGSTGGNKASLACAISRAARELETPPGPPKRYLHVMWPLPAGPEAIVVKFADSASVPADP